MLSTYSYNAEAESYWKLLKDARSEVKLRLITLLSQSIMDDVSDKRPMESETGRFLAKFAGAWKGNESAEDIIATIQDNRHCKKPISFD